VPDVAEWLFLHASHKAWKRVDPALFGRMVALGNVVGDRVTLGFAGSAWLKRRFHPRSTLQVHLLPTDEATSGVEVMKAKTWGEGPGGPKQLRCGLRIPTSWLVDAGDGLAGLRLFRAMLDALHTVGDHYGIGAPAAVTPRSVPGDYEVWDPFRPPPPESSYADINTHLDRLVDSLRPDQVLLAIKEPTSPAVAGQVRAVSEALGTVVDQQTLTTPDVKATAWIIQTRS
jgi:hypothetical protein